MHNGASQIDRRLPLTHDARRLVLELQSAFFVVEFAAVYGLAAAAIAPHNIPALRPIACQPSFSTVCMHLKTDTSQYT